MTAEAVRREKDERIELDFTGLFGEGGGEKRLSVSPVEPHFKGTEYDLPLEDNRPAESLTEAVEGIPAKTLLLQSQREREDHKRTLEMYGTYQENIRRSEQIQSEILKGAKAGEDIYSLFLKAVEAISRMTSNKLFLSQIEADLRSIYGAGLLQPKPLELDLKDTRERLKLLQEAERAEQPADSRQRIRAAIEAHQIRAAELEALIENAQKPQL